MTKSFFELQTYRSFVGYVFLKKHWIEAKPRVNSNGVYSSSTGFCTVCLSGSTPWAFQRHCKWWHINEYITNTAAAAAAAAATATVTASCHYSSHHHLVINEQWEKKKKKKTRRSENDRTLWRPTSDNASMAISMAQCKTAVSPVR